MVWGGGYTDRASLLRGLDAARAVVAHAAGGVALDGPLVPDQVVHLLVLPHARREFGPQVDQGLLVVWTDVREN